ncbi:MAG: DmsE family decaheme c-type cytochrome [Acidobacteriia bacterium]|nr:DmsE family decaheme c-type cytochrome [Terriglobia bacterium]
MTSFTGPLKAIKMTLISGLVLVGLVGAFSLSFSKSAKPDKGKTPQATSANYKAEDYVGADTCKTCHEEIYNNFQKTGHFKLTRYGNWTADNKGCEACHGPGKAHVDGGGDKTKIHTFEDQSAKQISETCLRCHAGKEEHNNFRRGEHWRNDVSCINCHAPHSPTATDLKMLVQKEPMLCISCHSEIKAQFNMPFRHKVMENTTKGNVLEGTMKCTDCHNPHGGFEQKQVRLATGGDAPCMKCHADKQGPFVFEHAPLREEGCTICHIPHGSNNPKLLKRNEVRILCLECHSNAGTVGAPDTPSFHNQATARFQNCTTCHVKIHGSNLDRFYFR